MPHSPTAFGAQSSVGPLSDAPIGSPLTVAATSAPGLTRRLAELGIRPGATVTVIQHTSGGGRVIDTGSARYAIDHRTLTRIEVHHHD